MCGSAPAAPALPDFAAAARAQGVADVKAAKTQAQLNTANTYTPAGSSVVNWNPVFDQTGYDKAMSDFTTAKKPVQLDLRASPGGPNDLAYKKAISEWDARVAPSRGDFTTTSDTPTITQTLTPEGQATFESQQKVQRGLADLGQQGINTAQRIMGTPFQYNGPQIQTSLGPQMPMNYGPAMGVYGMAGGIDPAAYGMAGSVGAGQYGQAQGVNAGSYGQAQGGVAGPNLQTGYGDYGDVQNAPSGGQYGQAGGINAGQFGNLRTGADMSGVAAMPVSAGMTGQQAIMARLQPQIAQQSAATVQQLANQGITPGSEAWNNAMREQQQGQNDLLSQAALQGIGLDMSANQQGYGQAMGQAGLYNAALGQGFGQSTQAQQLGNQAIGQNFGQGMQANAAQNAAQAQRYGQAANNAQFNNAAQLSQFQANLANQEARNAALAQNFGQGMQGNAATNAAIAQNYGQGMSSQELQNRAIGQNYGQGLGARTLANQAQAQNYGQDAASAGLYNQAVAQQYNQNIGAAQFGNTATQQAYQQQLAQYNQPLNQIAALMSGSQIQMPQFQAYAGGGNIQAAPVFAGQQAAGQQAMDLYGQQMAAHNAQVQGMYSLGAAALGGASKAASGGFSAGGAWAPKG